jgi:hypothetical protein
MIKSPKQVLQLTLRGYVKLADHGFALPCYSKIVAGNTWYVATSSSPFDHNGQIISFEPYEPEDLVHLPNSMFRRADIGDPWIDVFLWGDVVRVGTPAELWEQLKPWHDDIGANAPLSLLDLGRDVEGVDRGPLLSRSYDFIKTKFGSDKARDWHNDIYLSQVLKRAWNQSGGSLEVLRRALPAIEITNASDGRISISLPQFFVGELERRGRWAEFSDKIRAATIPESRRQIIFTLSSEKDLPRGEGTTAASRAEDGRLRQLRITFEAGPRPAGLAQDVRFEPERRSFDVSRTRSQLRSSDFLSELATSLILMSSHLSKLGRREEAFAATEEAVDIRRRLARARPEAFLPNLATNISVMSDALAALDRHTEAARAATEALEILAPFVERHPQSYGGLARTIGADVLRYSEAAGRTPDSALLTRVARVLMADEAGKEDGRERRR